jgi:predicted membrane-bound mannosyltransferase
MAGKYSLNRRLVLLVLPFLAAILLLDVFSMYNTSLTWDECDHVEFGRRVFERQVSGAYMQTMPITMLNYLPYRMTDFLGLDLSQKTAVFLSRLPSVLISLLLGLFVFLWSYRLYGTRGALLSLTLYAFCPNILAQSRLATTDIYCACLMFIALFGFVDYLRKPRLSSLVVSGIVTGLAQITKSTALLLFPVFVILLVVKAIASNRQSGGSGLVPGKTSVLRYLGGAADSCVAGKNLRHQESPGRVGAYGGGDPGVRLLHLGKVMVNVNALVGVEGSAETYRWLRDGFKPVDRIGYSLLIYDVPAGRISSKPVK